MHKEVAYILLLLFALFVYGVRDNLKTLWQAATICFSDEKKTEKFFTSELNLKNGMFKFWKGYFSAKEKECSK